MFDVIRVSRKDTQLYDHLCKTLCQGYHQIRYQDDPSADTELFQHVGGGVVRGRQAVLAALEPWFAEARKSPEQRKREFEANLIKWRRELPLVVARYNARHRRYRGLADVPSTSSKPDAGTWLAVGAILVGVVFLWVDDRPGQGARRRRAA